MILEIIPKPDFISWEDITDLLHQAFAEHLAKGLHYSACDQSVDVTRQRAQKGICLVALLDGKLVGTGLVTFMQRHGKTIGCLSQLGILPEAKGLGIGTKLKIARMEICRQKKVDAIYCDTSVKAKNVIRFNMQKGWQKVRLVSSVNTNYYSVVFRYPVYGRKYSQMEASIRYITSSILCRMFYTENGEVRTLLMPAYSVLHKYHKSKRVYMMNLKRNLRKYKDGILLRFFWRYYIFCKNTLRNKRFKKNGINLLYKIKEALEENGVFFWLEYGTLLGAYRDHDFISYDLDMDLGVFYKDADKVHYALGMNGFKLVHQFKVGDGSLGFEETYTLYGVDVDIFYFHKESDTMYCNGFKPLTGDCSHAQVKKVTFPFKGFSSIMFKEKIFNVPANIKEHLAAHYGDDFMIPKSNFDSQTAPNVYYYPLNERIADFIIIEK